LFKHVQASDVRIPNKTHNNHLGHQEEGSGQHITRHKSTPDRQEEGSGQHVKTAELPPSASPEPGPQYALISFVFLMSLRIIRYIHDISHKSPRASESLSPHLDDVTGVLGKFKGKPIKV
jgi:hypothetical protein